MLDFISLKLTLYISFSLSVRTYFYARLEDIVTACRAPFFRLNVLAETKKNFPKVFSNDHIKKVRKL